MIFILKEYITFKIAHSIYLRSEKKRAAFICILVDCVVFQTRILFGIPDQALVILSHLDVFHFRM